MKATQENIFVIDTCVLLNDPEIFAKLGQSQIVIPTAVIKELDRFKKNPDPKEPRAMAARKVARTLDTLGTRQNIAAGAKNSSGATVRISNQYIPVDDLASNADNRIVGTALKLQKESEGHVILVTGDGNMRNVTRSYGIEATSHPLQQQLPFRNGTHAPKKNAYWNILIAAAVMIFLVIFFGIR